MIIYCFLHYSSSPRQTLRPIINLSSNTPRLPIEDEFSTPHSVITISPESVIINTHSNLLTTKLTSEEPTTTDSKLSIDDIITQISTDSTIDKKTPQLFEPRPFSINTRGTTSSIKPYTETSTQITKVSETNNQFRLRPKASNLHDGIVSKQTSPTNENTGTDNTRSRSRLNINNRNIVNEDKPVTKATVVRSKKRFSTTTERFDDKYVDEDQSRTFRPSSIQDLSSLTAADIALINNFQSTSPKRGRPRTSVTTTTSTTEKSNELLRTSSRTVPTTRKPIDTSLFGKSKRIFADRSKQEDKNSNPNSIKRVRGIINGTATESPNNSKRKVIRRFRPGQHVTPAEQETSSTPRSTAVRQFRKPVVRTRTTTQTPTSSSRFSRKRLNDNEDVSNETDSDELSTEEGENIKLSESNIRENSELSNNGISTSDKPHSILSKVKKDKVEELHEKSVEKGKIKQSEDPTKTAIVKPTEPNIIIRTRKIIRKIKPTELPSVLEKNGTIETIETYNGRKRKIVRLYRPGGGLNDNSTPEKNPKRKKILIRGRPTASDLELTTEHSNKPYIHGKPNEEPVIKAVNKPLEKLSSENINADSDEEEKNDAHEVDDDDKPIRSQETTTKSSNEEDSLENVNESSENSSIETTSAHSNLLQRQRSRPAYIRPRTTEKESSTTTEKSTEKSYRRRERISTTPATEVSTRSRSRTPIRKTTDTTLEPVVEGTTTLSQNLTTTEVNTETTTDIDEITTVLNDITSESTTVSENTTNIPFESTTVLDKATYESYITNTTTETSSSASLNVTETTETNTLSSESVSLTTEITPEDDSALSPTTTSKPETSSVRKSTLRPINSRPRYTVPKRLDSSTTSTTDATSYRKQNRYSYRKQSSSTTETKDTSRLRSTTAIPINKFIYRYGSTTETNEESEGENVEYEEEHEEDEEDKEENKEVLSPATRPEYKQISRPRIQKPKIVNTPINSPSRDSSRPHIRRPTNKPRFTKPTETSAVTEDLSNINTEAVKNRNKNLFAEKRKMNTPFSGPVTQSTTNVTNTTEELITIAPQITEPVTKSSTQQTETTEMMTTLHHIFAEIETNNTANVESTTDSVNNSKKVEKLFEVNRIIEVKTKEAIVKNHSGVVEEHTKVEVVPTVDKLGAVSRITVIKVVGGNETESEHLTTADNEIKHETTESNDSLKPQVTLNIDGTFIIPEVATVEEVKPFDTNREERKFDILSKANYNGINNNGKTDLKAEIIDGRSHINIITPQPIYSTEASTIALQGLFQTDSPPGFNKNLLNANEELLETENSRFVNIRILGQPNRIPVRYDSEEVTMKAHVVEVIPKHKDQTIKIVPIQVEMSRKLVDDVPNVVKAPFLTKIDSGIPKVDIKLLKSESKQR